MFILGPETLYDIILKCTPKSLTYKPYSVLDENRKKVKRQSFLLHFFQRKKT